MALFKRKEQVDQQVPLEIQEYYQAEKKERAGVAWLLALGTLAVTLLLATGIFFGGRWVYRKAMDKAPQTATTSEAEQSEDTKEEEEKKEDTSSSDADSSANAPGTATTNSPSSPGTSTTPTTTTPATPTTPSTTSQVASSSQTNRDGLPSTGPGDVIAIFVIVSIAATLAHRTFYTHRNY